MDEREQRLRSNRGGMPDTRKLATMGMLAALGIVLVGALHIPLFPAAPYLEYDPADIPILICALIYGPASGFVLTVIVSLLQALLFSAGSGWIGFVMHVAATGAMVIVVGNIYKGRQTRPRAAIGLMAGGLTMTAVMVLMNLILTPVFMKTPREAVMALLVPVIIPFNLIKAGINCAVAFLIYKVVQKLAIR